MVCFIVVLGKVIAVGCIVAVAYQIAAHVVRRVDVCDRTVILADDVTFVRLAIYVRSIVGVHQLAGVASDDAADVGLACR